MQSQHLSFCVTRHLPPLLNAGVSWGLSEGPQGKHSQHTHAGLCSAKMRGLYIPRYWQMFLQGRNRIWAVMPESEGVDLHAYKEE